MALGERLFNDTRLSHDNDRSCNSCHDLRSNGASRNGYGAAVDGTKHRLNPPTVFNAALSFRLNWAGRYRTLESQAVTSLESPDTMGISLADAVARLRASPDMVQLFHDAYGRAPDEEAMLDAIATFERSLLTPGGRFDRWLAGDAGALSPEELHGYDLFKSLGCASCHQGVNIGGNLFARNGVFRRLLSHESEILRVPSLRNVATTPPYFHDGSTATLEDAIRRMANAQLNVKPRDEQVSAIAAFLKTLTGTYRGRPVDEAK